jgi:hypothetical protein
MALQLTVRPDKSFKVVSSEVEKRLAKAAMGTAKQVSDEAKAAGRAAIAGAGFGPKWQNSLRSKVFPPTGESLRPAVFVYHKIPYSNVFQEGRTISGKPLLWLPLPNVPIARGGGILSVSKFEQTIGQKLVTIRRPGSPPLLAARVRLTDKQAVKGLSLSQLRRGANISVKDGKVRRGRGTLRLVPLYIGIRQVDIKQKFDVVGSVQATAHRISNIYSQILKNLESSTGG